MGALGRLVPALVSLSRCLLAEAIDCGVATPGPRESALGVEPHGAWGSLPCSKGKAQPWGRRLNSRSADAQCKTLVASSHQPPPNHDDATSI
ncbi:hypothetical protein QBC34DRAFT_404155, partial [Podospora aff. communis PSN243]